MWPFSTIRRLKAQIAERDRQFAADVKGQRELIIQLRAQLAASTRNDSPHDAKGRFTKWATG